MPKKPPPRFGTQKKLAVALAVAGVIILGFALWVMWPSPPNESRRQIMAFAHKSEPPSATIDPPFGFHWGDSMAHVEALLTYSSAEVVTRMATADNETWLVEGLIQPGLRYAQFNFNKSALTTVDLQCQYSTWSSDRYRDRLEELRKFFDRRFGEKQRLASKSSSADGNGAAYSWRVGDTTLRVAARFDSAPGPKPLSVNSLIFNYRGGSAQTESNVFAVIPESWVNTVLSSLVNRKLQPTTDSNLSISNSKLLNATETSQTAYVLQLALKLEPDVMIDPAKSLLEVNFYDTLPNGEIVLTDAAVAYNWRSTRDWKLTNPENVSVTYIRKNEKSSEVSPTRRFYGYVATVYYDGRLESVRAEPTALINLFPVRTFLSPFENAQAAAARGDYVAAANLYRRAADQGNLFALENLAWFYAQGKGVDKDYRQAAIYYERAALQNTPRSLNALAWFLATCKDDSIRNGAEAVRHATKACELSYWQEWKYIDTLAAAWAECADFKRAIEYEQQALQIKDLDEATRKKTEDRLALYRKRQPLRE
jgi:hypothetical protein